MVDKPIASLQYKKLLFYIQKPFFFFRNNNFLGANESIKYFRNPYALNFSKNIILKFSALKCFHVEIMMEGTEQFHVPTMKFSKKAQILQFANSSYLVSCSFQEHCHSNKTSCQLTQLSYRIKGLFFVLVTSIIFVGKIPMQVMHFEIIKHAEYVQTQSLKNICFTYR